MDDPIAALLATQNDGMLAFVADVEGASYRPVGATMAILGSDHHVGSLSSGCIEADIVAHALQLPTDAPPKLIRYGRGSPYMDLQLPCGGGMDVLLVPRPNSSILTALQTARRAREHCTLEISVETGEMCITQAPHTGLHAGVLRIAFEPAIKFVILGNGPETSVFAKLVQTLGFPNLVLSPDVGTLEAAGAAGCDVLHLRNSTSPEDIEIDTHTAVVFLFHDHDWEPPLLEMVLASKAFYIGAQGSLRAREMRNLELAKRGLGAAEQERIRGPVGLIPSARDATTLAVSILAEVLALAMASKT